MLPGTVGLMQATEVIKLVLGEGLPMIGRLLLYDAMKMSFRGDSVHSPLDRLSSIGFGASGPPLEYKS